MSRKERRAAEHQARKAARKAGFPNPSQSIQAIAPASVLGNQIATAPPPAPIADIHLLRAEDPHTPDHPAVPIQPPFTSPARVAASRENGKHSHGALSEATKAISSQNRVTHGLTRHNGVFKLLSSEDAAGFVALQQSLAAEYLPTTATEAILVNAMAESQWLAQRAQGLIDTCLDPDTGAVANDKMFSLYLRYQTTHIRAFHTSLTALLKLRAETRRAESGFVAQRRKDTEIRIKEENHEFKKEDRIWKDPVYGADVKRLGMAGFKLDPNYEQIRAEFRAHYAPSQPQPEGSGIRDAA